MHFMNQQTDKAILVVSFGTSYEASRKATIEKIEQDIADAFGDHRIYRAWTSKMIISVLKKRDNYIVPTVKEAMEQMIADGIREVAVQPTHILDGIENHVMKEEVLSYKESFDKIVFGTPLLTSPEDEQKAIEAVNSEFSDLKDPEALVLMGHGTTHQVNVVYAGLDKKFKTSLEKKAAFSPHRGDAPTCHTRAFPYRGWLKPCALHHKKAVRTGIEGTSRHTLSASSSPERGSAGRPLPLQAETVLRVSSKHSRMPHERIQPSCTHVPLRQPFSGGHRRQPGTF